MSGAFVLCFLVGTALSHPAASDNLGPDVEIEELELEEFELPHLSNITFEEGRREHKREVKEETEHGTGLLLPETRIIDEKSENYFNGLKRRRVSIPDSYSSVDLGLVSPVKNQLQCGSCVAFSNLAVIETCFKKMVGVFGDYSEQQLVDCGFDNKTALGCDGAFLGAYLSWATNTKTPLIHEYNYPYLNTAPKLTCPSGIPAFNQGAKVDNTYSSAGTEDLLKQLVYTHGAVTTGVSAEASFSSYKGGIFSGCTSKYVNHAVTVVGYGTENGVDYWLIKNSWGTNWGENGFMRIQRGVSMCGIGSYVATVTCTAAEGPISITPTTQKPCTDLISNCGVYTDNFCWHDYLKTNCQKSCGLCEGMTPAASNTCFDLYSNCYQYTAYCTSNQQVKTGCKKSCKTC